MSRLYFLCVVFLQTALLGAPLLVPSSSGGIVDKEIEEQYEVKEITPDKEIPEIEIEIPEKQLNLPSEKRVYIRKIALHGNDLIACKILQKEISAYEDRKICVKEIYELCRKIQSCYAKKGYFLVRVYPPAQEIKDGLLRIEVMEAKLGRIEVVGNQYYKTKFIYSYFEKFLGKSINYNELMKTLLILNENTDLSVGTIFQKGEKVGTVDMILRVKDDLPIHVNVDYNNYGSSVTSLTRSGLRTDIGNLMTSGDTLSIIGVMGYPFSHLRFIDGIYNMPLNTRGSSLEGSFLFSDFDVDRLTALHLHGKTQVAALKFSQVLQRTGKFSSDLYTAFEYKQIQNFANHTTSAFDKLRIFSLGCKVDYMDAFRGRNVADMAVFCGVPDLLGGLKAVDEECSRKGAGGRFVYLDGNYQRIQRIPYSSLIYLNFQGQLSFYKLPLSEEFYIGGINTVRGYPLATALGDSGFCANLEFRMAPFFMKSKKVPFSQKRWEEVLQLIGFVDHGEVFVYGGGVTDQVNRLYLTSTGLGLRIFGPYRIDLSGDVGFPLINRKQKSQDAIFYFKINMRII